MTISSLTKLTSTLACLLALSANSHAESEATKLLKQRSEHLKPLITKVSPSVYTASGYSPANISMIVGTDGLVIVDTGMFPGDAKNVLEEFRKISDLPVKGIILTHGHGDHTGGAAAFAEDGDEKPAIFARAPFNSEGSMFQDGGISINGLRGARQGGFLLPPEKRINNGIAPAVYPPKKDGNVFIGNPPAPTDSFHDGRKEISVAGLEIELVAASGETADGLYVWFPEERVVFAGDNFYQSWPNLYAIRGHAYRDVRKWIRSLDMMIKEKPAHVVPGHTQPIPGEKRTVEVLTNYRDGIKHVFDKTIEGINQGMTPDQLVHYVDLPERLKEADYLREYYGNIEWGVRSIFSGYLGWYDGNPTNLFSLPPEEEARRMAKLAGGEKALREAAVNALKEEDAQWCAELCDQLLALHPEDNAVRNLKADALEALAEELITATGRNYYLTVARTLRTSGAY